jgi:hypothetical protein
MFYVCSHTLALGINILLGNVEIPFPHMPIKVS